MRECKFVILAMVGGGYLGLCVLTVETAKKRKEEGSHPDYNGPITYPRISKGEKSAYLINNERYAESHPRTSQHKRRMKMRLVHPS